MWSGANVAHLLHAERTPFEHGAAPVGVRWFTGSGLAHDEQLERDVAIEVLGPRASGIRPRAVAARGPALVSV
jgi:hypothetical protein